MTDLRIERVEQQYPHLGRQLVHDPRSRGFPVETAVDKATWRTKNVRIYDPLINPNQCHGECTGCAKAMEFNAVGNRVPKVTLDMDTAHKFYHTATTIDPFAGEWPPDDTGSSGLAAAKAAQQLGMGGEYRHLFGGADEIVQLIMQRRVVNVGVWWYDGLFHPNAKGIIEPTGPKVGGHQFIVHGYYKPFDALVIRCWWGKYRDVYIKREHLNQLVLDGGDAHIQGRLT
jgi:hypothetical protein